MSEQVQTQSADQSEPLLKEGGKPGARMAATRQRIIKVAAEQFNNQGYDSVSMETIALQAGVARSTVYRLFLDKEDLLRQVVIPVFDLARKTLEDIDTDQPDQIINGIGHSYLEVWPDHRDALLFASNIGQALYPLVQEAHDAYATAIHGLMNQVHETRMLRNDDPMMSAVLLAQTATRILKTCENHPQFETVFCHTLRGLLLKW